MANPTAGMLIIGDEILSGRTRDSNGAYLARRLTETGIDLREIRVVPDVEAEIVAALDALRHRYDHVFTSGGIGPTHDDITADAVAKAFGVGIDVREDARALLASNYRNPEMELNAARLRMARIPDGARLIDNPVSKAPGFTIGNVHVMAGVPAVFEAMVESVLPQLTGGTPLKSLSLRVFVPEGEVAGPLAEIAAGAPDVAIGSYPFQRDGRFGCSIVLRSPDPDRLEAVAEKLRAVLKRLGAGEIAESRSG
ncbi:MAG: competence/damage-inducible protein A [Alphaproteobacteria bacterium]|nr:MAG: competence/damage-inducible protein A [Alphaproteobacteria bacterium]